MVAAVVLLALSVPVHASKTDDQIVSSAKNSYVFKNYLKNDDVKIQSNIARPVPSIPRSQRRMVWSH